MSQALRHQIFSRISSYRELLHPVVTLSFSRPIIIFQSDDWGLAGIADKAGFDRLVRDHGLSPKASHLNYYSLETAADLGAIYGVLGAHRDSSGHHPILGCNFILANVDFPKVLAHSFEQLFLKPLHDGLPRPWERPGLLEAYREGVRRQYLYPGLHGVTHFCADRVKRLLREPSLRGNLLRNLFEIGTPLAYQVTPWVGFEFRDEETGWLSFAEQQKAVVHAVELFRSTFGRQPLSACAPGYRANAATFRAWREAGIKVAQHGPGLKAPPFFGRHGLLHLHRQVSFEPAINPEYFTVERAFQDARRCVKAGQPVIICAHSVNFHSTLHNFRELTLERLDQLLRRLEHTFGDLLYLHDENLWEIAQKSQISRNGKTIAIEVTRKPGFSPVLKHLLSQKFSRIRRNAE